MAFVVEDGTGLPDANSYASEAEGTDYYSHHIYNSLWTNALSSKRESALVMATRHIDGAFTFKGTQISVNQALKWPRYGAVLPYDPNSEPLYNPTAENINFPNNLTIPSNVVPLQVKKAVLEMARFLLAKDRDTDQDKSTVKLQKVDVIEREFFEHSAPDLVPELIKRMLGDLILSEASKSGGGAAVSMSRG